MILERVILFNIGPYLGRHEIDLMPEPGKPVVLIGALNGSGKTTLLESILIGLYGSRAKRAVSRGQRGYEELLKSIISRQATKRVASIEIQFQIIEGTERRNYHVIRSWRAETNRVQESVAVNIGGLPSGSMAETWGERIEAILPFEIAQLLFFDGERIEALADPNRTGEVIRTAVSGLLGLGVVDQLTRDLAVVERRKIASSVTPDNESTASIQEMLRSVEAEFDATQRALADANHQVDGARRTLEHCRQDLQKAGGDLFDRRDQLQASLSQAMAEIDLIENELRELAAGDLPLQLNRSLLGRIVARERHESAIRHAAAVLDVLEDRDSEVLALTANVESSTRVDLERFLMDSRSTFSGIAKEPLVFNLDTATAAFAERIAVRGVPTVDRSNELITLLHARRSDQEHIDRQLDAVPDSESIGLLIEEVRRAETQFINCEEHREKLAEELIRVRHHCDRNLDQLRRQYDEAVRSTLEAEESHRIVSHSRKTMRTLEIFKQALVERSRMRLETEIGTCLSILMRKEGLIERVVLAPDSLELSLFDSHKNNIDARRLSAGERQLLAVAVLWSLARVSGLQLPVIVDTPLGRLDSKHRQLFVDRYLRVASDQVIVLSTDEEIDEDLEELLSEVICRRMTLQFDAAADCTTVINGYFPKVGPNVA